MMRFIRENRGSSSLEFVLLAIPLFLPIFIFMNFFEESTDTQTSLRTLAREAARTYVTSTSDEIAAEVMSQVIFEGSSALGYSHSIRYWVRCSQSPCIYPNGRVAVTIVARLQNSKSIEVTAIEYVSPWA